MSEINIHIKSGTGKFQILAKDLEIISPVTGSLCVAVVAVGSEDIFLGVV